MSERDDMWSSAAMGLCDGDLAPLAAFIRAGYAVDPTLAEMIADAIEAPEWVFYRMQMHAVRKGVKPLTEAMHRHDRDIEIGAFVERQLRNGVKFEAAIALARSRWQVERTVVTSAVTWLRRWLRGQAGAMRFEDLVKRAMLVAEFPDLGPG